MGGFVVISTHFSLEGGFGGKVERFFFCRAWGQFKVSSLALVVGRAPRWCKQGPGEPVSAVGESCLFDCNKWKIKW